MSKQVKSVNFCEVLYMTLQITIKKNLNQINKNIMKWLNDYWYIWQ